MLRRSMQKISGFSSGSIRVGTSIRIIVLSERKFSLPGERKFSSSRAEGREITDPRKHVVCLWRDFFSNPSQWSDHRHEKGKPTYPDFKHKTRRDALWIDNKLNPSWVAAELSAMTPGSVQWTVYSWNAALSKFVRAGEHAAALRLFHLEQQAGMIPDRFTFVWALKACGGMRSLKEGRHVHAQIQQSFYKSEVSVANDVVRMYSECGSLDEAFMAYSNIHEPTISSLNAMIRAYTKCGQSQKALDLFQQFLPKGVEPVDVTFVELLNACASLRDLEEGKKLHAVISQTKSSADVYVGSGLVNMYVKCGSIQDALLVLNKMPTRNVVAFSTMIWGYVRNGQVQEALALAQRMEEEGVEPDRVSFAGILSAFESPRDLGAGKRIHERIVQKGLDSHPSVRHSLISMYLRCGSLGDARELFDKMADRSLVAWNSMIWGYVKSGQGMQALALHAQMQEQGVRPDRISYLGFLNACAGLPDPDAGKYFHREIVEQGYYLDETVANSLIDMYGKCGNTEEALRVFNEKPLRGTVSWNSMIHGLTKTGQGKEALALFSRMCEEGVKPDSVTFIEALNACASVGDLEEGKRLHKLIIEGVYESDVVVCNSLLHMYAKCGSMEEASEVFKGMQAKDAVSWSAMIQGYLSCGQGQKAIELSHSMLQEGTELDSIALVAALNACASVGALDEGRRIHAEIMKRGNTFDAFVRSSLIDMYAKCGSMSIALNVFNEVPKLDTACWNALLGGYAMHGYALEAFLRFEQMCQRGVEANGITFLSLLAACSHAGFVDEGVHYIESMVKSFGIRPSTEHYACMVDILGRAGRTDEAEAFMKTMVGDPDITTWMSLLSACRLHGKLEVGERVAKEALKLDSQASASYVLLSNMYASAGKWTTSEEFQRLRRKTGVRKQPGCSWLEVNGEIHSFTVDDRRHPETRSIYTELERLTSLIERDGYVPDQQVVMEGTIEGEQKVRSPSRYHSERVAIAFGVLKTPHKSAIRIFKNLRVCSDCHRAIKCISKIIEREIIVRDCNRFHHFKDGHCSCGEYW